MTDNLNTPFAFNPGSVEQGAKRVRAFSSGDLAVDSAAPLLVWEHRYYPQYFFEAPDLEAELQHRGTGPRSKILGISEVYDVTLADRTLAGAARRYPEAPEARMRDAYTLTWSAFDTWLEEDEIVYTHPRSPYVRIDTLPSSRHVRVTVGGEVVADSSRPVVLYETGLPPRYYLPRVDVRMDVLTPTATTSQCPYKGTATYWTITAAGRDLIDAAWGYATPLPEAARIAGLIAFWPEKHTELELTVDGQPTR